MQNRIHCKSLPRFSSRSRQHPALHVYDGRDFVGTVERIGSRFTATTSTGKRSTFASMIEATRALPTVTTTIINNKPAQRGRAGLKVHPTEGRTRLLHAD